MSRLSGFVFNLVAAILFVAVLPLDAAAQVMCIPPPTNGVPGLPGPPDWIGTFNPPNKRTDIEDPRWIGSGSLTWADGTSGDTARFRALSSGGNLFLSWFVELPPNSDPAANTLYVGFTQAGGAPTNFAMTISLKTLTPGEDTTDYNPAVFSVDNLGNPTALGGALPAWISSNTRVWITVSGFAVQTVVPITAAGIASGVNLGTDFKMWFEMQAALPPATPATVWDAIFPDGRGGTPTAVDVTSAGFATQFPPPSSWASFHQSTGPGDPACTLGGVSITQANIGTQNPVVSQILFKQAGTNTDVNTFFASPTNGMTTAIPAGGITATFRIADWGSTYDPNAPFTTIPGGQDVPSTAIIPAGATAANTNITFKWTVQDVPGKAWLTEFRGGREPDQCMLVELAGGALSTWQGTHAFALNATIVDPAGNLQKATVAGTSGALQPTFSATAGGTTLDGTVTWTNSGPAIGPGLTFLNNSVLRNMDFVGASEFRRDATIDIQGLPPLSAAPRDVYLYVQTANMPSIVETVWKDLFNRVFGAPAERNSDRTQQALARMSTVEITQTLPAYRVYVFHDAAKKITVSAKDYLIIHPQSGFGYYVLPHADVVGWVNALQGAQEIAANLYRIAVPNNGKAKITTTINALETLPGNCFGSIPPIGWILIILAILVIGLLVYWRTRTA